MIEINKKKYKRFYVNKNVNLDNKSLCLLKKSRIFKNKTKIFKIYLTDTIYIKNNNTFIFGGNWYDEYCLPKAKFRIRW